MGGIWPRRSATRRPRQVWAEWRAADEAGDVARAEELAREATEVAPDTHRAWFDAALLSKARRDWPAALERNERALSVFTQRDALEFGGDKPAAWNLGIAATALGDWETARRAWRAYGIDVIAPGSSPIDEDFGLVPVRLNPDRPSLPHQVTPQFGEPEVVWCWRRSPAHALISSVPLPESGHRFRDVVLHDGEPKGSRVLNGREVSVFDELDRLEDSGLPTLQAQISRVGADDLQALTDLLGPRGLGVDEWSRMRLLCADCSHGSPTDDHTHPPADPDVTVLGLAGPENEVSQCIEEWLASRPWAELQDLSLLW